MVSQIFTLLNIFEVFLPNPEISLFFTSTPKLLLRTISSILVYVAFGNPVAKGISESYKKRAEKDSLL
jgi:hypothetical protein